MNMRDSEIAAELLQAAGHTPATDEQSAELIIVNTCSVRAKAEAKALGKSGLLLAERRTRPQLLVGVIGCMVQRQGTAMLKKLPKLNFALTPQHLAQLPTIVAAAIQDPTKPILAMSAEAGPPNGLTHPHAADKIAAFINILYGCDRRCSYCIVPSVRGTEYSRPPSEILEEARAVLADGVREITLLGQSVMRYGKQRSFVNNFNDSPAGFAEPLPRLLEMLCAIPGLERLRFTSGHPQGCSAELAQAMSALAPVCEHLHLPLQSGADRILKLMRRGYIVDDYRQAVARLRQAMPNICITTDIIVGFPSETPAEFEQTAQVMDEIGFDNAFIFKYSPRPGTPAAIELTDDVTTAEKLRRNHILIEQQNRRSLSCNQALVGTISQVLAEGPSPRNPHKWTGRTRGNKIVVFKPTPHLQRGDLINIPIRRVTPQALYG